MSLTSLLGNIGVASRGANDALDAEDNRQYLARVRASGVKQLDAADSLLPDQTAAARAKYGLSTATDTAALPNVGKKAALEGKTTDIATAAANDTLGHLPTILGTADNERQTKLAASKTALAQAQFSVENLPNVIAKARASQALDDVQTSDALFGGLGHALAIGDKSVVLKYLNSASASGLAPQLQGKQIGEVGTTTGADGKPALEVRDTDGKTLTVIPGAAITAAYERMTPAKYQALPDGGSLFKITKDGAVQVANNPKDIKPEDKAKIEDARVTRAKSVVDSYFGANSLNKLDDANQPRYKEIISRAGAKVRAGTNPEDAAKQAIDEVERNIKLYGNPEGTPAAAAPAPGAPAAPAAAGGVKTFAPWK